MVLLSNTGFFAASGSADYVWDPIGYVQTSGSTGDGTPSNFQFNNIPGDYKHLVLQMGLRRGTGSSSVKLTLNGTGTNNHYWGRADYVNGTAQNFYGTNGNQPYFYGGFGGWDGFQVIANVAMHSQWWFLDYADSSCVTTVRQRLPYPIDPNSYYSMSMYNGTYNVESAITSIQIVNATNHFGHPSVLTLYGLRDE